MIASVDRSDDVLNRFRWLRVMPVIVIDGPDNAVPLARALAAGGLSCAEITFRTARADEALRRIAAEVPELLTGAGTVLTPAQAESARLAGAQFVVAPGFSPPVVEYCLSHGIPVYPGIATPTDIELALRYDLSVLKFFPAEQLGGVAYLKAIAAPYAGVEFMPTGGINRDNLRSYLAFDRVVACGGSWMAPADWIARKEFDRIREAAEQAMAAAHGQVAERVS